MRLLADITEDEMIATFLRAEIASERFAGEILTLLAQSGDGREIIERPDTTNTDENAARLRLLGDFRGWRRNAGMFQGFPEAVTWHRAALGRDELARVRYIDYSYWNALSGGSRLATDGARNVRAGVEIFGMSTDGFWQFTRALDAGASFPKLILIGPGPDASLVVMEGHARLTGYFLAPARIPDPLEVLVGFAPDIARWGCY